jgi:hypothetical protein
VVRFRIEKEPLLLQWAGAGAGRRAQPPGKWLHEAGEQFAGFSPLSLRFAYQSFPPKKSTKARGFVSDSQRLQRFVEKIDRCAVKNVVLCSPPKISRLAWRQAGLPSSWHC